MKIMHRYIEIEAGVRYPLPDSDLEWECRYGPDSSVIKNRYEIASILSAYYALVNQCNQKQRNKICKRLQEEIKANAF